MLNLKANLLTITEIFEQSSGLPRSVVSFRAFGDVRKIGEMRAGADITVGRAERALVWFSANWPAGAQWPDSIARPDVSERGEAAA